jgi:hypothetical protein
MAFWRLRLNGIPPFPARKNKAPTFTLELVKQLRTRGRDTERYRWRVPTKANWQPWIASSRRRGRRGQVCRREVIGW